MKHRVNDTDTSASNKVESKTDTSVDCRANNTDTSADNKSDSSTDASVDRSTSTSVEHRANNTDANAGNKSDSSTDASVSHRTNCSTDLMKVQAENITSVDCRANNTNASAGNKVDSDTDASVSHRTNCSTDLMKVQAENVMITETRFRSYRSITAYIFSICYRLGLCSETKEMSSLEVMEELFKHSMADFLYISEIASTPTVETLAWWSKVVWSFSQGAKYMATSDPSRLNTQNSMTKTTEAVCWKPTQLVSRASRSILQEQNTFAIDHFSKVKPTDRDPATPASATKRLKPTLSKGETSILDVIAHVGNMLLLIDCWYKHGGSGAAAGYDRCRYGMFNICCKTMWNGIGRHLPVIDKQIQQVAMATSFSRALAVTRMRNSTSAEENYREEDGMWSRMAAWISDILLRSTIIRTGHKNSEPAREFNYNYATELGYMRSTLETNRELEYYTSRHTPVSTCPHATGIHKLNSTVKYFDVKTGIQNIWKDWPSTGISRVFYLQDTDCKEIHKDYFMKAIQDALIDDKLAPVTVEITQPMVTSTGERLMLNPQDWGDADKFPEQVQVGGWGNTQQVQVGGWGITHSSTNHN